MTVQIKTIPYGSDAYAQMLALRDALLRVPLNLEFTPEELARDIPDTHVVAVDDGAVVGGLIITMHADGHAQLRQMAVATGYQGTGLGLQLVRYAEAWLAQQGAAHIELHARVNAQGFYEKAGYEAVGTGFTQATLPHIRMIKPLR